MDPTECGTLIAQIQNQGVKFIHDPNAMSDKQGQISKTLNWQGDNQGNGVFASLQVNDKSRQENKPQLSIHVSWGEYVVLESLIRYSIPKFLGFDKVWDDNVRMAQGTGMYSKGSGQYDMAPLPSEPPSWKTL
jgi:hypothetical protein